MAKVVCKDPNEIFYIQIGNRYDGPLCLSKKNFKDSNPGRHIDTRILKLEYYDGWENNEHHITSKCFQNVLAPFFSYFVKTFNFNIDDFEKVPFFGEDYKYDCSYLKPISDMRFTMNINGVKIGEHLTFDQITNVRPHNDKKAFKGYEGSMNPLYSEYHRLYRGSHACSCVINETVKNDLKIFISGDSMMIPLIPILCCYYKEVVYMDNRDNKSHKDYFEDKVFDEVLLCFYEPSQNKVLGQNLI